MKQFRYYFITFIMILGTCACWGQKQHGKASYYSKRATGAKTASGERVHHDSLTCAHRSYPFGTVLKVTNLSNQQSVEVKVTDRGPYGRGRIIDLSWAAAKAIGMLNQGIATVKIEVVDNPVPFRPKDNLELPQIDFEVADAGYSFIDRWKEAKPEEEVMEQSIVQKEKEKTTTKEKTLHAKQVSSTTTHAKITSTTPHKPIHEKEKKEHPATKKKISKGKSHETESSSWGEVFDKIKNWGSDLF